MTSKYSGAYDYLLRYFQTSWGKIFTKSHTGIQSSCAAWSSTSCQKLTPTMGKQRGIPQFLPSPCADWAFNPGSPGISASPTRGLLITESPTQEALQSPSPVNTRILQYWTFNPGATPITSSQVMTRTPQYWTFYLGSLRIIHHQWTQGFFNIEPSTQEALQSLHHYSSPGLLNTESFNPGSPGVTSSSFNTRTHRPSPSTWRVITILFVKVQYCLFLSVVNSHQTSIILLASFYVL